MDEAPSSRRLAALLRDRKEDLIERWTERVLGDPGVPEANRLSEPALRDHIPALIDRIARCLEAIDGGEASGRAMSNVESRHHALNRFAQEYRLTEALSELSHFRAAILDLIAAQGLTLEMDTVRCLHAAIDQSMISGSGEMERAATEKAREGARFRERFIAILGHDLRNPLQSIKLAASLLRRDGTTEPRAQLASRIVASADRMGRMITDLLDVTRARFGGGIPIEPKRADLCAVARQVIDELEITHPNRTVLLDAQGDVCGVWDPDRMAQVMSNLTSNALDYSPSGTPVRVILRGEVAHVLAVVNNRGPTIAPEAMGQLFEPFAQGSQCGRVAQGQGLGLGLFITQQIVHAHGGSIDVASTADEGTTFTVRVPRDSG
jgi:signal transduction histidine kinase